MTSMRLILAAVVFHACLGFVHAQRAERVPGDGVFVASDPAVAPAVPAPGPGTLRERFVRIDLERLGAVRQDVEDAAGGAPVLQLNLFDDARFSMLVDHTGPTSSGYSLSGSLGGAGGTVTLVVNGDVVAGSVRAPGATYQIRSLGAGAHVIRQIDPTVFQLPRDDAVLPPTSPRSRGPARGVQPIRPGTSSWLPPVTAAPPAEDGSRIDILVVYTRKARVDHGGTRAIRTLIDLLFAETNQAYAASGVRQRVHLAHAAQVGYVERGRERLAILKHLTVPSDGHLDEVHRLRSRYAADIVHLMVDKDVRGLAWQVSEAEDAADWAFNFLGYTGGLFFAHENGHNMGIEHDRYEVVQRGDSPVDFQRHGWIRGLYSFGYVNQRMFKRGAPPSSRWWTIMAYPDQCLDWARDRGYDENDFCYWKGVGPVMRFSNPRRRYNGDPTGIPGNTRSDAVNGSADARRSLNDTRRSVANFRRAPCLRDGTKVRLQASNGHYVVAAGNGGGDVLADRPRIGAWGRFTLVDANGGCVETGDTISLHTSDGFYLRARQGGGSTLDATAPRATPWARFVARRHGGGGLPRSGDLVTVQSHSGHYVWAVRGGGGAVRADRKSPGVWGRFRLTRAH